MVFAASRGALHSPRSVRALARARCAARPPPPRPRGSWPFWAYALADARWLQFDALSKALPAVVWLINVNDFGLALVTLGALLWAARAQSRGARVAAWVLLVFRDATLWRETVEYLWDHHRLGYPHTVAGPLRPHSIAALWSVNALWLVAPLLTCVWVGQQLLADEDTRRRAKVA